MPLPESQGSPASNHAFATTHWSAVVLAGGDSSPDAQVALEQLCQAYWYPLYAYVRRLGRTAEDAQDLTQEFFARLIEKRWLESADQARGKFRSFLLTAFKYISSPPNGSATVPANAAVVSPCSHSTAWTPRIATSWSQRIL